MHADDRALAPERQHDDAQLLDADEVLRVAAIEGVESRLVEKDYRLRAGLSQPAHQRERPRQHQPEDLALDRLALLDGGERLAAGGAQHPPQREGPGDLDLGERELALLDFPEERAQRLPCGRRRQEALDSFVVLQRAIEPRIERRRAATPVAHVQLGVPFRVGAQTVQPFQRLRDHVFGGVATRELRRGGDVREQRLLQRQLELRVRKASDSAGGEGGQHRWPLAHAAGDAEVCGFGVMEDDGGDARLRIHHAAVGQLHADLLRPQHTEEDLLVLEPGAGGVTERVPLPVIVRLEPVDHRRLQRIRESPLAAQLGVQELRIRFGRFQRERLEQVALEEVAVLLVRLGAPANAAARGGHEHRDRVVLADVVGQAKPVGALLPREGETRDFGTSGIEHHQVVAFAAGAEELVDGASVHGAFAALGLEVVERRLELQRLASRFGLLQLRAVAGLDVLHDAALQAQVAAVDHHRVDEAPDVIERRVRQDMPLEIGRPGALGELRHLA